MRPGKRPENARIKTQASIDVDLGFIAHLKATAAQAVALSANGVGVVALGAAVQEVTAVASPAIPRALSIVSNKSNGAGNVLITGTNFADEVITETLALNGTTTRNGAKAFKTVTKVNLPAQVNAAVLQVETATAVATVSGAGNAAVTVTSALFEENEVLAVPVLVGDNANAVALAIRTALAANETVSAHYTVSGANAAIILTAKVAAANDATLNIAIATGTATGVTTAATSANTTAGVAPDVVSIGWNDVLGLPYKLAHNTVIAAYLDNTLETTAPAVVTSATAIESNTVDLHSALDGSAVDVYLIA